MVNVNAIAQSMVESVVVAENGEVTSVNFDVLDKAIADVRAMRKVLNEQFMQRNLLMRKQESLQRNIMILLLLVMSSLTRTLREMFFVQEKSKQSQTVVREPRVNLSNVQQSLQRDTLSSIR